MLEIIKIIAETVAKSLTIESVRKARREKQLADLGTELFLLYSALNSIIATGRRVVEVLEDSLDWLDRKSVAEPNREFDSQIGFMLQQQQVNILRFVTSLKRLGLELQVIAPGAFSKLGPLIYGKQSAIRTLLDAMSGARLISVREDKVYALMDAAAKRSQKSSDPAPDDAISAGFSVDPAGLKTFQKMIVDEGIENLSRIPARQNHIVRAYLQNRQPGKELNAIEVVARQLRAAIADNFSLQDILLGVGDHRSGPPNRGVAIF